MENNDEKKFLYNVENLNSDNIEQYANDKNYPNKCFIQNGIKSWKWEYQAQVLKKRGFPEIQDVLDEMFVWLQDMNWPGAYTVVDILSNIPRNVMIKHFKNATEKAVKDNDIGWLYWLREFMEKNDIKIQELNDNELYKILISSIDM